MPRNRSTTLYPSVFYRGFISIQCKCGTNWVLSVPGIYQLETGSSVGLAGTPFWLTLTSTSPGEALVGTWKLIW
jgi:hypothetical protein